MPTRVLGYVRIPFRSWVSRLLFLGRGVVPIKLDVDITFHYAGVSSVLPQLGLHFDLTPDHDAGGALLESE